MAATAKAPVYFLAHAGAELYGADRVCLESAKALVSAGAQVAVSLPCGGPLVKMLDDAGARVFICPSPVLRKSMLNPWGLLRLAGAAVAGSVRGIRLLRKIRPDALYVNTVTIPLWPVLGKTLRIPVLVHVHEAERTAAKPVRTALALPLMCAARIVCNSNYSALALAETLPRLAGRTRVVDNAVPGPTAPAAARTTLGPPLRVLYVGRLSQRKGVHTAIAAVAQARAGGLDVELDIVGAVFPGNEGYLDSLHGQVAAQGVGRAVHFHGFDPDVWKWFAACDVAVMPSAGDEPFGDTAVEAVQAGRPVIASRTPGLAEAVGGYACVQLVPVGDPAAMAAALRLVQSEWPELAAAAVKDSAAAATRHSPARYGARIQAELLDLLPAADAARRLPT